MGGCVGHVFHHAGSKQEFIKVKCLNRSTYTENKDFIIFRAPGVPLKHFFF